MGLEWEPLSTPKRGYEREFVNLLRKLATAPPSRREQISAWILEVADPPFATIGAPRVGFDPAADAWLVERVTKSNRLPELEQIRVEMRGYNVLELMPVSDGFSVYSNFKQFEHLERYSFNAELLVTYADVLGTELFDRLYTSMLAEAHAEFASRMTDVATKFWLDNNLPDHVATIREPVFPEGSLERKGHILYAAAKWCTYWSQRGYGLAAAP
jgi:hypothetical protein